MSAWTHSMCVDCWNRLIPEKRIDAERRAKMTEGARELCCWCGCETWAGIYYRADPAALPTCQGHES